MKIKFFSTLIAFILILFLFVEKPVKVFDGLVFGTYYSIKAQTKESLDADIQKVFDDVNNKMSVFTPDSEINSVNNNLQTEVSSELRDMLLVSKQVWHQSQGAFDPTIGALIELWGFGVNKEKKQPSDSKIQDVMSFSGFDKLKIENNIIIKSDSRTKINLSAIAKGYGVDKIAEMLNKKGIKNYLIDIGGEVKAKGLKKGKAWKIGLSNPLDAQKNQMTFDLTDMAVATSGDYNNYFKENGTVFSHTINPKSGYPVKHSLASVSVFNKSCMLADAYATAIMALGEVKGAEFAKSMGINAILITHDGNILHIN